MRSSTSSAVLLDGEFIVAEGRVLGSRRAPADRAPGLAAGLGSAPGHAGPASAAGAAASAALLQAARERARALIESARIEAERLAAETLARARVEADALREEARAQAARALEEARQQGLAEGRAQAAAEGERLLALAAAVQAAKEEYLRSCEGEVVDLALAIAERIVGQSLALDRQAVCAVADRALSLAGASADYCLRVNPADAETLREHLERAGVAGVSLVIDVAVEEGGCVVSTAHGRVDAQPSHMLDEIRRALQGGD